MITDEIRKIAEVIKNAEPECEVYLVGDFALNTETPESHKTFAVVADVPYSKYDDEILNIGTKINSHLWDYDDVEILVARKADDPEARDKSIKKLITEHGIRL